MIPATTITYPPDLPVSQRRDDIARAIEANQVVIVAGETGSGKTTQLPKILLELGYSSIGHTQPRRIAARTIAERIAEELGSELGGLVGYRVRFTDQVGKDTRIKLMTDGILLNELQRDRTLKRYDAIIIDEAHERSLTIDFLIGYLKQLLPRRPDLKVVITSATIDPESFAKHFATAGRERGHSVDAAGEPAPIFEVSGRTYPVEVRYRPLVAEDRSAEGGSSSPKGVSRPDDELRDDFDTGPSAPTHPAGGADRDYLQGINDALDELSKEAPGDVLVFLSGETEIRDAADAIRGRNLPNTEVLPLYGRLSAEEQHRVFRPAPAGTRRRVVLATNVAETSLTVPGIRYVIDAGTARISRYSARSKIQRLPIEAISQASARQRSGRSGRTSPGIAIRLYSEEDFDRRPEFTDPEILRTNLAAVILQMISLGLGDIQDFPFLQPPDSRGIKDGLDLLTELGAITASARGTAPAITPIGKQLTQLPIDPRLARMVIESKKWGTTREVMAIVAGISIQDPRERPLERRQQADGMHARFVDPTSDFLTLLNLWNHLEAKQKELSGNAFRRLVKSEFLNYLRIREWQDVYRQLTRTAKQLGLTVGQPAVNADGIHKSILAGLLSHLGIRDLAKRDYQGARQSRFVVFPGSALAKKQPDALMSAELVETSRLFARVNAKIDPAWAEPIAGDLAKRSYSEPHWERKQGAVIGYERVTLYGLPIIQRRKIQFSRIDLPYARDLFIRNALVDGQWDSKQAFDVANRALRARLEQVEERTRRRDILLDDEAVYHFYERRIPADVASTRDFEGWWKKARVETPDLLTMTEQDLLPEDAAAELETDSYPEAWRQGGQSLGLGYRFEPGAEDDGVTVTVPLALLPALRPDGFDWQVPGLREELVVALIKSLPKQLRKNVVPAGDWARRLLASLGDQAPEQLPPSESPEALVNVLAREITTQTYAKTTAADFDLDRIPPHLRMTFSVIDERGKQVSRGKVLSALQASLKPKAREQVAKVAERRPDPVERTGITTWDFDALDRVRDTDHGGNLVRAYPALVDDGAANGTVSIRLMGTPHDQALAHRAGVQRLLLNAIPTPIGYVQEHLTTTEKLALAHSPYQSTAALFADCMAACVDAAVRAEVGAESGEQGLVFERAVFERVRDAASSTILDRLFETVGVVAAILTKARQADKAIRDATSLTLLAPLGDARAQLDALVHPGFVSRTGLAQLRRIPVYLDGLIHRLGKLTDAGAHSNGGRDRVWQNEVEEATARYLRAGGALPLAPDAPESIVRARWMLEELRLSLFAQHLPTAESVSLQRITKVLSAAS
jgi:ATP-dependent helicase HrpA